MTHTACGVGGYVQEDYPYDNAGPGPARSWHFEGGTFVDRSSGYADVMSYCSPQLASDFNYQQMVLYFQSSFRQAELAKGDVCRAESAASPQSIAIVGTVQHDGSVTITGTAPSARSPLPPPRGGSGLWLTVSAGGAEHHRQPLQDHPAPVPPTGAEARQRPHFALAPQLRQQAGGLGAQSPEPEEFTPHFSTMGPKKDSLNPPCSGKTAPPGHPDRARASWGADPPRGANGCAKV